MEIVFFSRGNQVVSFFESEYLENPNYHQSSDLPATVNFGRVHNTIQSAGALFATVAKIQTSTKEMEH